MRFRGVFAEAHRHPWKHRDTDGGTVTYRGEERERDWEMRDREEEAREKQRGPRVDKHSSCEQHNNSC